MLACPPPADRSLEAGERISEHEITAEKQKNGDVRYAVNVMVDGHGFTEPCRESEGVTREQAERYIEKVRTEAREGRLDLPKGRKLHRSALKLVPSTSLRWRRAAGGLGQQAPPPGATPNSVLRQRKKEQGMADASINRHMATLLHMLNRAASKD